MIACLALTSVLLVAFAFNRSLVAAVVIAMLLAVVSDLFYPSTVALGMELDVPRHLGTSVSRVVLWRGNSRRRNGRTFPGHGRRCRRGMEPVIMMLAGVAAAGAVVGVCLGHARPRHESVLDGAGLSINREVHPSRDRPSGFLACGTTWPLWRERPSAQATSRLQPASERGALLRTVKAAYVDAFVFEQPNLLVQTAREPGQAAIRPHNPMTGDDDADGIVSHGTADSQTRHAFLAKPPSHRAPSFPVRGDLPSKEFPQRRRQTSWRNLLPMGARGRRPMAGREPAKYSSSHALASSRTAAAVPSSAIMLPGMVSPKYFWPSIQRPHRLFPSLQRVIPPMGDS